MILPKGYSIENMETGDYPFLLYKGDCLISTEKTWKAAVFVAYQRERVLNQERVIQENNYGTSRRTR